MHDQQPFQRTLLTGKVSRTANRPKAEENDHCLLSRRNPYSPPYLTLYEFFSLHIPHLACSILGPADMKPLTATAMVGRRKMRRAAMVVAAA